MISDILLYFEQLPTFLQILIGVLFVGLLLSIFKKLLKTGILIAVLIILILVILKLAQ